MGQTDQKPTYLSLRRTEIPIPLRALKGEGSKQYTLPEPILEADSPLCKVKQEVQEPIQNERPFESERLTVDGIIEIVKHDPLVFFRGSSIPLSTDFTESFATHL